MSEKYIYNIKRLQFYVNDDIIVEKYSKAEVPFLNRQHGPMHEGTILEKEGYVPMHNKINITDPAILKELYKLKQKLYRLTHHRRMNQRTLNELERVVKQRKLRTSDVEAAAEALLEATSKGTSNKQEITSKLQTLVAAYENHYAEK